MKPLKIFMGFDPREKEMYDLARYSILKRTSVPIKIIPLELGGGRLQRILTRPVEWKINELGVNQLWCPISEAPMSTEFAISRFAVPFMQDGGWAVFMDCDMICLDDIDKLFELVDNKYAVMVVKHNHIPEEGYHDAGQIQTKYNRKNWSSLMLWNIDHPGNKNLTLDALNTWPGRDLHAFKWLKDEEIGEIPQTWNYLVGVSGTDLKNQSMLHYTNGHPGWETWEPQDTDYIYNNELFMMKREKTYFYSEFLNRVGTSYEELHKN